MKICTTFLSLAALSTVAIVAAGAVQHKPAAGGAQEPGKTVNAAMPKLTPAPEHIMLQKMVGNWDAVVTTSMPGSPVSTSTAKAVYKAVGDIWVESEFSGSMDGTPFVGHGVDGYDTNKKKFVSMWVDSMTSEMMVMEGTNDAATHSTTMIGESHDMMTNKLVRHRMVTEMKGDDSMTFHMFSPGADGKEFEMMKIEYKRKK